MEKMIKPNLFIVGAAKSGTTLIHNILDSHPEIHMSPIKEPNFFGRDIDINLATDFHQQNSYINFEKYFGSKKLEKKHIGFVTKEEDYKKLFVNDNSLIRIFGESSTSYLYSKFAAEEIYIHNKNAKIIMVLRDPVERIISHYKMDYIAGRQINDNLIDGVLTDYNSKGKGYCRSHLYIELSLYYQQIKRYLKIFDKNQVLILNFEDLITDLDLTMSRIFRFLEVESLASENWIIDKNASIKMHPFLNNLKWLKGYIPRRIIDNLKNLNFLKSNVSLIYSEDDISIIRNLVLEDWNETLKLINE